MRGIRLGRLIILLSVGIVVPAPAAPGSDDVLLSLQQLIELEPGDAYSIAPDIVIASCTDLLESETPLGPSTKGTLLWWRMRCRIRLEKWTDAFADAEAYLTLKPNEVAVKIIRARLGSHIHGPARERDEAKTLLLEHPDSVLARAYVASLRLSHGDAANEEDVIAQLLALDDTDPMMNRVLTGYYQQKGDLSKALFHANRYIKHESFHGIMHPENAYLGRGEIHRAIGNTELALKDFQVADRLNPESPLPRAAIISVYYQLGRNNIAMYLAARFVQSHPSDGIAHACHGDILFANGKRKDAGLAYDKAIELRRRTEATFSAAIATWILVGSFEQAFRNIEDGLEMFPTADFLVRARLAFLAKSPIDDHRDGEAAVKLATTLCDQTEWKDPLALFLLAAAEAEAGRFDEALRRCEQFDSLEDASDWRERFGLSAAKRQFKQEQPLRLKKGDIVLRYRPAVMVTYNTESSR